jgi:chemotaxis protein methyltransferase CheR
MNEAYFPHLERLITARTGLHLRPRERDALRVTLTERMAALHLNRPEDYQRLLEAGTPATEREWEQLTVRLTNNESYFFRDKGQMALLRDRLLPELFARNRERRTLRLWSAGCATGEEAYSLAFLVEELLPQFEDAVETPWKIVVFGTDIDTQALRKARRGIYSAWSFRTMEAAQRQRWFQPAEDGGWRIREKSRSLVTFRPCNLFADPFPGTTSGIYEMDLILCRNVFIYFAPAAVTTVLGKFAQTLREGGYLITGHSEMLGQRIDPLMTRHYPESVAYQRVGEVSAPTGEVERRAPRLRSTSSVQPAAPIVRPVLRERARELPTALSDAAGADSARSAPAPVVPGESALAEAEACYSAGDNAGTIQRLETLPQPSGMRALLLLAHAQANLGHREEATACCRRLNAMFPFAAEPYELLASLAVEQGRYEEAKLLLKQALYLAPGSPTPYLELGHLYDREGDRERGRKMRATALELLKHMSAEATVGFSGGPTAQEWRRHLEQRLIEGV